MLMNCQINQKMLNKKAKTLVIKIRRMRIQQKIKNKIKSKVYKEGTMKMINHLLKKIGLMILKNKMTKQI